MDIPEEITWLYKNSFGCKLGLGAPVHTCPVTPTDIELVCEEQHVQLTLRRCPRIYMAKLSATFTYANDHYLFDAVHKLQVLGGAGQVWRRITCPPDAAPHWRPVLCYDSFRAGFVGRPWDWPDRYLPTPDPVYGLEPGAEETTYACLTPLTTC